MIVVASLLNLFDSEVHCQSILAALGKLGLVTSNPTSPSVKRFLRCFLVEHANASKSLLCLFALLLLMFHG
jgi:hypothetical protein